MHTHTRIPDQCHLELLVEGLAKGAGQHEASAVAAPVQPEGCGSAAGGRGEEGGAQAEGREAAINGQDDVALLLRGKVREGGGRAGST